MMLMINFENYLEELKGFAKSQLKPVPILQDDAAEFLRKLVLESKPKNILEIGTAIGYSGSIILHAAQSCESDTTPTLTTIEKREDRAALAMENFKKAGFSKNAHVICGDAREILPILCSENKKYDFIFLDGPKAQYACYFEHIRYLMPLGGLLVADNVMVGFSGIVNARNRPLIRKRQEFIDAITLNPQYTTTIHNIADNISVTKKIL